MMHVHVRTYVRIFRNNFFKRVARWNYCGEKPLVFCQDSRRAIVYMGANSKQGIMVMQMMSSPDGTFEKIFQLNPDDPAKFLILDYGHILKANRERKGDLEVYQTDGKLIYKIQANTTWLAGYLACAFVRLD